MHPADLKLDRMQRLLVHEPTLDAIRTGKSLSEVKMLWAPDREPFRARREHALLYR
jgi:hypothetical protein